MKEDIFEAALAEENTTMVRADTFKKYGYGVVPEGYSRLTAPLFDMNRVWGLLDGAIDTHIHSGPDAYNARCFDELELAIQACEVGMRAVMFKCHSVPSSRSVYFVQKAVDQWAREHNKKRLDCLGGVVLNYSVGGINPEAVSTNYRIGGRIVWLPNMDASFHHKVMGTPGGIDVLDDRDKVVPALREIFEMIAEADMVLCIGHQSTKERFILIDEARQIGVRRIEVVHPNQTIGKMTIEQMKIAADKGAYLGLYPLNFRPQEWNWDAFLETVRVVGTDRLIISSDCGHFAYPRPVETMRLAITGMLIHGVPDADAEKMVKTNAANLLY